MSSGRRWLWILSLASLSLICGALHGPANANTPREDWLRQAFIEHDRAVLARDPGLVAAQYARMARTSFTFFRGTAWLYPHEPSACATRASSQIALTGDPHPENVGIIGEESDLTLEFNDFDLAGYGSYVDDLRRLALGLQLTADLAELGQRQQTKVVAAAVDGYLAGVRSVSRKDSPDATAPGETIGARVEHFLAKPDANEIPAGPAMSPGDVAFARAVLAGYVAGSHPPSWLDTLSPTARSEPRLLQRLFTLKRVARTNAGIASFSVFRLRVVVEGPTSAENDDWTLEIKESLRPAAEIVTIQRQYNPPPLADPFLGWASVGERQFRLRRVLPTQRRLSVDRIVKYVSTQRSGKKDLRRLAFTLGRLLAKGHCTALDGDGHPGLVAISSALTSEERLRAETLGYAERHTHSAKEDLRLFRELLIRHGPTLDPVHR